MRADCKRTLINSTSGLGSPIPDFAGGHDIALHVVTTCEMLAAAPGSR